ncbi:MAG: protein translocase subunit SecF [Clostridia bacterium]
MTKFHIKNWNCKIVEKKKIWFSISAGLIAIGLLVFLIFGFNVGIDFSGGTILTTTMGDLYQESNYDEYKNVINDVLSKNGLKVEIVQKLSSDTAPGMQVRYQNTANRKAVEEKEMFELNKKVRAEVEEALKAKVLADKPLTTVESLNTNLIVGISSVGATASAELLIKAFVAIAVASLLILGYVAIRFEFLSGATAVIALIHDILIMCACMAIFRIQINASFVAALITIVGYSINNTIVLFDRVRENLKLYQMRDATPTLIINTSIKDTFTRSMYTSLTTMITIVLLAILGVPQMREFALPIIFGLLAGTYSSMFIAPPLWAWFKDLHNAKLQKSKRAYQNKKAK